MESESAKNGQVRIRVTGDGMEAYINVVSAEDGGKEMTYEDAQRELRKAKIEYGINEELLKEIFESRMFDREILIASGLKRVDGIDGEIKYYFDTNPEVKPKEDEKGNVDFKDLNLIQSIKRGQKLAEVIPPKHGTEGKTVIGKTVPPKEGKIFKLPQGKNTMPDPENPNVLISAIDGHLIFKGKILIEIEPAYIVSGNVDYNTGNINYVGSIVIKGDVKSGFEVKVDGDVDIGGVVEDAKIEAGGKVLFQKGIIGRGAGIVRANGDVIMKYIENQTVYSKGNVIIGESARHSKIYADGKVVVKGKKGFIMGGEVVAAEGVETKNLGNYQNIRTDVSVGINEELKKKLEEVDFNIQKSEENEKNVKNAIGILVKMKYSKKEFPPEKQALLEKMQRLQKALPEQREEFKKERASLIKEMEKYSGAEIVVLNKVYPGVKISIQNQKYTVDEERSSVAFKLIDKEVVCEKCK